MKARLYRTGVIGLGRIGFTLGFDRKREQPASHSRAFGENRRILLAGGFDSDPAAMREWGRVYKKARIYRTLPEMLRDGAWDILAVAVPEERHLSVMKEVLPFQPGLIVLEKPAAANLKDALQIEKLAGKFKTPVLINHERRFSKDYLFLKEIIKSKQYGVVKAVNCRLFTPSPAWKKEDENNGKGALIRDGTHILDILNFLIGNEISIENALASKIDKKGNISGISCLGMAGEIPLTILIGFQTGQFEFEIDITFQKGRVRIGNGIFEVWEAEKSPYYAGFYSLKKKNNLKRFRKTGYFSGMVRNCIDFLDGKKPVFSKLSDGIETLRLIEKIKKFVI